MHTPTTNEREGHLDHGHWFEAMLICRSSSVKESKVVDQNKYLGKPLRPSMAQGDEHPSSQGILSYIDSAKLKGPAQTITRDK
jgi:hypothetical protein